MTKYQRPTFAFFDFKIEIVFYYTHRSFIKCMAILIYNSNLKGVHLF